MVDQTTLRKLALSCTLLIGVGCTYLVLEQQKEEPTDEESTNAPSKAAQPTPEESSTKPERQETTQPIIKKPSVEPTTAQRATQPVVPKEAVVPKEEILKREPAEGKTKTIATPEGKSLLFQKAQAFGADQVRTIWANVDKQCQNMPTVIDIVKMVEQNHLNEQQGTEFISGYKYGIEQEVLTLKEFCGVK